MRTQSIATEQMNERFNDGTKLPYGWFTEGWEVKDSVAQKKASSGFDMTTMMGGGGSSGFEYLMTPPLQVQAGEKLVFSARKAKASGMGAMMGGSGPSLTVEKSVYGSNQWEKLTTITESLDSVFKTLWVSNIEPGDYRFRFVTTDSIVIDQVSGFRSCQHLPEGDKLWIA